MGTGERGYGSPSPEAFPNQVGRIHELTATAEQVHLGTVNKYRIKN